MRWSLPVKTDWMHSQANHKPTALYAQDIYSVASRLKDFAALEIGAAWGVSALAILEAGAKHLTSVDDNVLIKAPAEVEANGYTDKWEWNCVKSGQYWIENDTKFDLVYVDGSHLYDDVSNDLEQGWLRTSSLLLVDDWDHRNNIKAEGDTTEYGVSLACFEFWRDHVDQIKRVGIEGRILWFEK